MGIIIGKFRKKKTTLELLETLDGQIKSIEEYRRNTEQTHKKIVGRFILISVGVYLLTALIFYFYFFPAKLSDQLFYIIPLLAAPVIILSVKRILTWYYNRKISKNQTKLVDLRNEKKKTLDRVMDTETYKVAKEILEKFAPEQVRKPLVTTELMTPVKQGIGPIGSTSTIAGLRQRALPGPTQQSTSSSFTSITATPSRSAIPTQTQETGFRPPAANPGRLTQLKVAGTTLPMPRSILPRERSVLDKMVEYLVGDGPSNRFALICSQCSSHNGMALPEEFEYISFRCCYCFTFNPSRKKRPVAPKLESDIQQSFHVKTLSESSSSEKHSPNVTDSEPEDLSPPKTSEVSLKRFQKPEDLSPPKTSEASPKRFQKPEDLSPPKTSEASLKRFQKPEDLSPPKTSEVVTIKRFQSVSETFDNLSTFEKLPKTYEGYSGTAEHQQIPSAGIHKVFRDTSQFSMSGLSSDLERKDDSSTEDMKMDVDDLSVTKTSESEIEMAELDLNKPPFSDIADAEVESKRNKAVITKTSESGDDVTTELDPNNSSVSDTAVESKSEEFIDAKD